MARNAEKAMTALARWRRMKLEEERGPVMKRPARVSDCTEVRHAERWRRDVIRDIAKKIAQIQNPGLGEFKIRDVNDEINKLLKIKFQWEARIKELGGPDYKRIAPRILDNQGRDVPGNRTGYKYFGAARDLPGVRELFEKIPVERKKKRRAELMRDVDADYYGYMDDDDGILLPLEAEEERKAIARCVDEWEERMEHGEQRVHGEEEDEDIYAVEDLEEGLEEGVGMRVEMDDQGQPRYIAHVPVPTQKDIEEALLHRKKMELLDKYVSEDLLRQSQEAQTLLGAAINPQP